MQEPSADGARSDSLRRLWAILQGDSKHLRRGLVYQFFQCVSYIPFYAAIGILIDQILNNASLTTDAKMGWIGIYALAILLLWPIHGWLTIKGFSENQLLVRGTIARLRQRVVEQLQRMSMSYFTRKGAGALSNQMTVDLTRVETFLGMAVNHITTSIMIGIIALVYLLVKNPSLAILAALAAPIQVLMIRLMSQRVQLVSRNVQESGEVFSARIVEFIAGMKLMKSFGNEGMAAEQMSQDIQDLKVKGYDASILLRWMAMTMQIIWEYTGTIIWCVGGIMYLYQKITLGDLVAFTGLMNFVRQGMMACFSVYESWSGAKPGMDAILNLLDSEELEQFSDAPEPFEITGKIDFKGVSFAYPLTGNQRVLHEIDVTIQAGQSVGLVGETGAGKSSFLDLLMGFHLPSEGTILYDEHPLQQIGLRRLRRQIAVMSQDAFLWNISVMENIRYGRPAASDDEVIAAARKAQADDFIKNLPYGYATPCGERGSTLSGGQRQRIAMARVFLRNPKIIILDEPTSALDVETEMHLLNDLDQLCAGVTTFIVAHRLSTLRKVDRILVFKQGRIIEHGSRSELLAIPDGHFKRLTEMQAIH